MTLKGPLLGGLFLLGIGLERLLNLYLLGGQAADLSTRLLIGLLCTVAGILLLGLALTLRWRQSARQDDSKIQ